MPELMPDPAPDRRPCLDLEVIEALASDRPPDPAERSHLDSCRVCRGALEDFMANARLLARFRRVIGTGAEPKASAPVDLVPGYQILDEISRGSQGVIYKAIQERTKRVVALKMLLQGTFATEKQRRRFEREVEIAAALKHPGIVTIYDVTLVRGGRYAYAMEFIDGVRLDEWRPPGKNAREKRESILRLFIRVCDAAQYAHYNGVMHRDLKPANIIVDGAGGPHVLDFGIAKATGSSHTGAVATMTAEFAGTLAYASPEQVAGNPELVDARTDVYSLGVMLYLLLCERPPSSLEGSILDVATRIRTEEPAKPRSIDPSIEADLEAVMLHALRKDPAERYQSPGSLGRDLERCLAGEPVTVKRDSGWYMFRKTISRHRRLITALVSVALLLLASVGAVAYSTIQAIVARGHAASEREKAVAETVRVGALSAVLREILPPARVRPPSPEARQVDEGLQRLRGKVALGYVADDPAREAAAQMILALAYRDRGILAFSEEAQRLAMCRLIAEHGETHPAVAQALHDLAGILLDRQRLWEAENYSRKAIRMRASVLGTGDPKTAESRELLARVLVRAEKPAEALHEAEAAAATLSASGEKDGIAMARCLDTQAAALVALGRFPDAERAGRQALAMRLGRLSDDEPEVAQSLNRLADILAAGAGSPESADLARAAGLVGSRELALQLRDIAASMGARAATERISDTGTDKEGVQYARARAATESDADAAARIDAALDHLLALKRAMLGARSRAVGQTLAGIGWRLLDNENYEAAERPLREAISILEAQYGPDDLVVANCVERLAISLLGQYRFAETADCIAKELRIWRVQPGAALDGVNVSLCQRELAHNLTRVGRYEEAIPIFKESIAGFGASGGPMHHSRGLAMSQCSLALLGLGRSGEAEVMAREGREIALKNQALPEDQKMQVDAALGLVLMSQGNQAEAEPLLQAAEDFFVKHNWPRDYPRHPDYLAIEQALGRIRDRRGDGEKP